MPIPVLQSEIDALAKEAAVPVEAPVEVLTPVEVKVAISAKKGGANALITTLALAIPFALEEMLKALIILLADPTAIDGLITAANMPTQYKLLLSVVINAGLTGLKNYEKHQVVPTPDK